MKKKCSFCGNIKFNGINILLIIVVCIAFFIVHKMQMKEFYQARAQQAQNAQTSAQNPDSEITNIFNKLQDECFLQGNQNACEQLQKIAK